MQVLFVDTLEGAQIGPKRCARPLAGVPMDFALTIPLSPRAHSRFAWESMMVWMTATITLPFIRIE